MSAMARYTLLRFLIFFGVLLALGFIPMLRANTFALVLVAAVVSLVVSAVLLKPLREQATLDLQNRVAARKAEAENPPPVADPDASAEDAEVDGDYR